MTVFEDLIDELKGENLLEDTVFEMKSATRANGIGEVVVEDRYATPLPHDPSIHTEVLSEKEATHEPTPGKSGESANESNFFRKRAVDEVSSLQMVEHIISGIEREYMKIVPAPYDDLEVKKALHKFLQLQGHAGSEEHSAAEQAVLQETENWYTALSERDERISVANLRRFCENSRPALSSQALITLAKFYRNAAYSESVRGKFDFVITRLFSRDAGEEKRRLLFSRDQTIAHIKTLYADWASLSVYENANGTSDRSSIVGRFDDFAREAEAAESVDSLLEKGFFDRVRLFKEETGVLFYAPETVAAAIECNVRIGNKFVELVRREKMRSSVASIQDKYGYAYDQIVSDAAGRTLQLEELLGNGTRKHVNGRLDKSLKPVETVKLRKTEPQTHFTELHGSQSGLFGVNRWFLLTAVVVILLCLAAYVWAGS